MENCSNKQFTELMNSYQTLCSRWYRHVNRNIKIDRETFTSDFQFILFKTMVLFNIDKTTAPDRKFERYFISSLKKYADTLKRQATSKKYQIERKQVSFCLKKHHIIDLSPPDEEMIVNDLLDFCRKANDKGIVAYKWQGFNAQQICRKLSLTSFEYKNITDKLKSNSSIIKALRE